VSNVFTILNESSPDLNNVSVFGTVFGDELSHNSEGMSCINFEVRARTEEIFYSCTIWVHIASVFITNSTIAIRTITAFNATACLLTGIFARVKSIGF